jgi:hypothetical protein
VLGDVRDNNFKTTGDSETVHFLYQHCRGGGGRFRSGTKGLAAIYELIKMKQFLFY